MMQSVMITNGGPHPASKWAEATASHIIDIADHVAGEKRGAAIKLQAAIIDILEEDHAAAAKGEHAKVHASHDHLQTELDSSAHVDIDVTVRKIITAAAGTQWEADFAKPEMADHLKVLLTIHYNTNADIQRQCHCDRHPDVPQVQAYKQMRHAGEGA
jgi:hypothetical protein